jgi:hypothetical protein
VSEYSAEPLPHIRSGVRLEILAYMEETAAVWCRLLATALAQGNLTLHWLDVHRVCRQLSHLADTYVAMRAAGHRRD